VTGYVREHPKTSIGTVVGLALLALAYAERKQIKSTIKRIINK